MAGLSFIRVIGNAELDREDAQAAQLDVDPQSTPLITGLAGYIRTCWDAAKTARQPITNMMLKALRQRNGEYDASKLAAIQQQGGSDIFVMITEVKCRAAESWLRDILMENGRPPWDIQPTPLPSLSESDTQLIKDTLGEKVMQMVASAGQSPSPQDISIMREVIEQDYRTAMSQSAQNRADGMRRKIEDQFAEGGWAEAFDAMITDLATFPCAFLKGPVVRRQRVLEWDASGGKTVPVVKDRLAPEFERVDPFRIYPEPGITRIEDGYLFEHHPLTRTDLADLLGVPGYDSDAIRLILDQGAGVSWVSPLEDAAKAQEERKFNDTLRPTAMYDALEFWGKVSGKMLLDWGMDDPTGEIDPAREYDANVWLVGSYVIKAVLNYDPLGHKPYCKTSFIKSPGAFWGKGIPEIIEDLQAVCNAAVRALVNNMGIASGPQVEVNLERLPPNEPITQIAPWKIWQVINDPMGSGQPAVRFTQPEDNANTLMGVFEKFSRMADDHSGIPAYIYGDLDVQGAGRTSSGLSMLMGAAGKGIRQVVGYIDSDILRPILERQFIYNMRYDEDESIKGDVQIMALGSINMAAAETTNVRRVEFLQATANEIDMGIIGAEGRAALLREIAKGLRMPVDDIIPSRDKSEMQAKSQSQQVMSQMAAAAPGGGKTAAQPQLAGPIHEGGDLRGGNEGNIVRSQMSGNAQ